MPALFIQERPYPVKIRERYIVPPDASGARLNDYARSVFTSIPSRKGIQKAILRGEILVDGRPGTTALRVRPGQIVELAVMESWICREFRCDLDVVHEDDYIAVISKPGGIDVNGNRFKTVENALPFNLAPAACDDALDRPRPVHRIDNRTSGLVLIAKTGIARIKLGAAFHDRKVVKRYRAIVVGKPERGVN